MVLQKCAMKELRGHLFFTQLRLTSTATRNRDACSTWSQFPTAQVKLWSSTSAVRQMSNRTPVVRLWDWSRKQFQVSWHLQRLGTSKWKVLCWKVGKWRRWRQVIPVSRLWTNKYHLKVHLNNVGDLNDMECDDIASQSINSIGDFWRVFVR